MAGAMSETIRGRRGAEPLDLKVKVSNFTESLDKPLSICLDKLEIINSDTRLLEYFKTFLIECRALFTSAESVHGGFSSPTLATRIPASDMVSTAVSTAIAVHHHITSHNEVVKTLRLGVSDAEIIDAAACACLAREDVIKHVKLHKGLFEKLKGLIYEELATTPAQALAMYDSGKLITAIKNGDFGKLDDETFAERCEKFVAHLSVHSPFFEGLFTTFTLGDRLEDLPIHACHAGAGEENETTGLLGAAPH